MRRFLSIAFALPEFITEERAGGLATYYDNISRLLADAGNKVVIFVLSDKNEHINYYHNVTVERLFFDKSNIDAKIPGSFIRFWSRQINNSIREYIEKGNRIDIIQYPNFMGLGFDRLDEIPTIIRVSSFQPYWRAASQIYFDINKDYECETAVDYIESISIIKADAVYCPSEMLAEVFENNTGRTVEVLESPFNPIVSNTHKKNFVTDKRFLLTHCTLNIIKGAKLIGECIYDVLKANPDLMWVFAGEEIPWINDDGNAVSPAQLIKKNAMEYSDRVIFLGKVKHDELFEIIDEAEACILPSRVDNLPNACIEAMAMGKIVIATKGASFEQLICDGENGFLVERENGRELISAINSFLRLDCKKKEMMSKKAKERIDLIDPSLNIKKLIALYRETINRFEKKNGFDCNIYYEKMKDYYNNIILKSNGDAEQINDLIL